VPGGAPAGDYLGVRLVVRPVLQRDGLVPGARRGAGVAGAVASLVGENSLVAPGGFGHQFYQAPARRRLQVAVSTGFKRRNCLRKRNISRRIVRITEAEAKVLSPRVRGK